MKLKYKPQSTLYTCEFATQAIALNSLLGADYNDLDVLRNSEKGLPLALPIFLYGAHKIFKPEMDKGSLDYGLLVSLG